MQGFCPANLSIHLTTGGAEQIAMDTTRLRRVCFDRVHNPARAFHYEGHLRRLFVFPPNSGELAYLARTDPSAFFLDFEYPTTSPVSARRIGHPFAVFLPTFHGIFSSSWSIATI